MSRQHLAGVIGETIWGPVVLTEDQREECYRIADAVTACGYKTGDGAADAAQTMGGSLPLAASSSPNGPGPAAVIGGQPGPDSPRLFELYRHVDKSGVSGTGVVASGVRFPDGAVALRWLGDNPSTATWGSVLSMIAVHGHSGATEVRWLDDVPIDLWPAEGATDAD